jgi:hypothetical protein
LPIPSLTVHDERFSANRERAYPARATQALIAGFLTEAKAFSTVEASNEGI